MADSHPSTNWRTYIPPADTPRSVELANSTAYEWAAHRCAEPFIAGWKESWDTLLQQPYNGITIDGNVIPNLYRLADETEDHGAPVAAMVEAANSVLTTATAEEQRCLVKAIDAPEWRQWLNPEIYVYRHGVRLEETSEDVANAIYNLMRASLSPAGYYKASGCMKVNQFLGEAVNGVTVLNERSYNFTLFGTPSTTEPWGWQLSGHHFNMNCFILGTQMTVTPVFMGAEPNVIDEGPHKGTELFTDQEQTALKLIHSMDGDTRTRVRVYKKLSGAEYPSWRYHRADQRHLGGAFQDNRVIPFEGVKVTTLSSPQQDLVRQLVALSLNYLPERALTIKMDEIAAHWGETHFSWIGTFERETAFYYKVHSPVVMVEFDHHSGVFLNNKDPLPFHIHTLVRTPNGNDYGREWLRQYATRRTASWPMANPACCQLAPVSAEYEGKGRWEVIAGVNTYVVGDEHAEKAVIDIYDVFGVTSQTIQGADRLASQTSALIFVPDYFNGKPLEKSVLPPDTEEKLAQIMAFMSGPGDFGRHLETTLKIRKDIGSKWPQVEDHIGIFGLCWGGKIAVLATGEGNTGKGRHFKVSGTAHPAGLDAKDAEKLNVPHLLLASPGEPAEVVAQCEEIFSRPDKVGEVETYLTMFHGWMGARADLKNEANVKEYQRGYKHVANYFSKYL